MRRNRSRRRTTFLGLSVLVTTATLTEGAVSAGADSRMQIREPQYGFSFALPANWKQVPLNGSDITDLLNTATHDDPALANGLSTEVKAGASKGMKVFAIGPVVGSSVPNVNVIVGSSAGEPTGHAFAQESATEAKIEFAEIGAQQVKTSIVKTRLGTEAEVTYVLNLKNSAAQFGAQLYLQHKSHIDIVTSTAPKAANSRSSLQLVIETWRWK
jgi:hypothetical protein